MNRYQRLIDVLPFWLYTNAMIEKLKLSDLKIIRELPHHKSLRALARSLNVEPQNLSKIIKRIETDLGIKLIRSSPTGFSLNSKTQELSLIAKEIFEILDSEYFETKSNQNASKKKIMNYSFNSRVFLNACVAPRLILEAQKTMPEVRYQFVDGSPNQAADWARSGLVDFVLAIGEMDLGKAWVYEKVGSVEWGYYCRVGHEAPLEITSDQLKNYKIIGHSHIDNNRIKTSNCLPDRSSTNTQHCTETSLAAMQIASSMDAIAFLPDLILNHFPVTVPLRKIWISDLKEIQRIPLLLYSHADRVRHLHMQECAKILKTQLNFTPTTNTYRGS